MKQDIRLYIDNELVDFSSELSMPFNYQLEDTNNPTILKNMFTKTITIVGTPNNNKVFGNIYNLDRKQLIDDTLLTGAYFNPSKRTPFQLFRNGELIESGYMQLNSITMKNKVINFEITLFGGIGDFLYGLQYSQDNEPLTLSDLKYKVRDKQGNVLESDREMDFRINAEVVAKSWKQLREKTTTGEIQDYISFIPSYNGSYENFDNNKVLINTHSTDLITDKTKDVDGKNYSTYNGYVMADLKDDFTEWSMRDLRSYHQRPALKMSKFIEAICDTDNNNGYTVNLDTSFFNSSNPYYNDAYIALPLLTSIVQNSQDELRSELTIRPKATLKVGSVNSQVINEASSNVILLSSGILSNNGDNINASFTPVQTKFDINIDYQLSTQSNTTKELFDAYLFSSNSIDTSTGVVVPMVYNKVVATATMVQVVVEDAEGNILGYSNIHQFSNYPNDNVNQDKWVDFQPIVEAPINRISGSWKYSSANNRHYFSSKDGNTFRITAKNIKRSSTFAIKLYVWRVKNDRNVGFAQTDKLVASTLYTDAMPPVFHPATISLLSDDNNSYIGVEFPDSNVFTNAQITKDKLLKTEKTPADYLLSYCKLFGLYFSKDTANKTIKIEQRNNYFKQEIIDLCDRIDKSKDIRITPIIFDNKFYRMALEPNSDHYNEKYQNEFGVNYGQKRINTNYNFNAETKDLLTDNVYQKTIPILGTNKYYRNFYDDEGKQIPAFMVEGITYKLFNENNENIESTDITLDSKVNLKATEAINSKSGYDAFEKECFFKLNNNKETLADISSSLIFFNGMSPINTKVTYWLTDDTPEMALLNDNKSCYLYTESAFDANNQFIGYAYASLPQFLSIKKQVNNVKDSFDFAPPREVFIPDLTYDEQTTLYDRYWKDFYTDQLDINTKKISCYVNLNGINVNSTLLRNFYHYGNSYWILNKIENYEPNKSLPTKCELIRVQSINNYIKPIGVDRDYIDTDYSPVVNANGSQLNVTVKSNIDWKMGAEYGGNRLNITSGTSGETVINYRYTNNSTYDKKVIGFSLIPVNGNSMRTNSIVTITQLPQVGKSSIMRGTIKNATGGTVSGVIRFVSISSSVLTQSNIERNGKYEVYAPLNVTCTLQVVTDDGLIVFSEMFSRTSTTEFEKDITITGTFDNPVSPTSED